MICICYLIKIDGKNLQSVKLRDYRQHLGVVLQDNFLFDGTILSNIRFANPHADFDEIKEVCRDLKFNELISHSYVDIHGEIVKEEKPFCEWVSSHTCRRSFCTNNWLNKIPNWIVMKYSKHKDEKTYLKYVKASKKEGMQEYIDTFAKD